MDGAIVSRASIDAHRIVNQVRAAFARGADRDAHKFGWNTPEAAVWHNEWDRCEQATAQVKAGAGTRRAIGSPP